MQVSDYAKVYIDNLAPVVLIWPMRSDGTCACPQRAKCPSPGKHPRAIRGVYSAAKTPDVVDYWGNENNIGLAMGESPIDPNYGVFALDVDPRNGGSSSLESLIQQHGTEWLNTLSADTGGGGNHYIFRYDAEEHRVRSKAYRKGIDIKGEGGYIVVEPSNHASGGAYSWTDWEVGAEPMPEIAEAPDWLLAEVAVSAHTIPLDPDEVRQHVPLDDWDKEHLAKAIECIPADEYHLWVEVGLAIKAMDPTEYGWTLWHKWSSSVPEKYNESACDKKWAGFKPDMHQGAARAKLTGIAQTYSPEFEWGSSPEVEAFYQEFLENSLRSQEEAEAEARAALTEAEAREQGPADWAIEDAAVNPDPQTDDDFPAHLYRVPGVLGEYIDWVNATSHRVQPILALAGGIALMGTLCGRRYKGPNGERTNVYVAGIARTGAGKERARQANKAILFGADPTRVGGEDIASDAGLFKSLEVNSARLFQLDEFGLYLESIMSDTAAGWRANMVAAMLRLYSGSGGTVTGVEKASAERVDLDQPCVCIYGTSTPVTFFAALKSRRVVDGFLNRILLFPSMTRPHLKIGEGDFNKPPASLMARVKHLVELDYGAPPGSDMPPTMDATIKCDPYLVPISIGGERELKNALDYYEQQLMLAVVPYDSLWVRAYELTMKLAIIYAVSENAQSPEITGSAIQWAGSVVTWCLTTMVKLVRSRVADTVYEDRLNKVMAYIANSGGWVKKGDVTKAFRGLPRGVLNECLTHLLDMESIEVMEGTLPTRGRPATLLRAAVKTVEVPGLD